MIAEQFIIETEPETDFRWSRNPERPRRDPREKPKRKFGKGMRDRSQRGGYVTRKYVVYS